MHALTAGLQLLLAKKKKTAKGSKVTAAARHAQQLEPHAPTSSCLRAFLDAINLGIYAEAFELAGYGGSDTAEVGTRLSQLTAADLAEVQVVSRVPILPHHQATILVACQHIQQYMVGARVTP